MKNEDNKIWRKMTKNIKNGFSGLPTVIPPRWQEENRYTERMHDRLTKIERINERMVHEMTSYKDELSALTSELRNWEKEEDEEKSEDLVDSLNTMAIATSKTSDCLTDMIDSTTSKVFPIIREMNKYNLSVLQLLRRRNSLNYQLEKISEALSLKRCDLENLKLNSSFSMINLFSSDPERSRSERSAQLDFEISRYKEEESKLKSKLKIMEAEIEVNLKNYHKMRADQLSDAFRLMAASQTHFHDMAAAAWSQATREQFRQIYEQNKIATEEINDLPL